MTEVFTTLVGVLFIAVPAWMVYKVGHENGYKAARLADIEITKVDREQYGDCPTCCTTLNAVTVSRVPKNSITYRSKAS